MNQTTVAEPNSAKNQVVLTEKQFDKLSNAVYSVEEIANLMEEAHKYGGGGGYLPTYTMKSVADQLSAILSDVELNNR